MGQMKKTTATVHNPFVKPKISKNRDTKVLTLNLLNIRSKLWQLSRTSYYACLSQLKTLFDSLHYPTTNT